MSTSTFKKGVSTGELTVSNSSYYNTSGNHSINGANINAAKCWASGSTDNTPSISATIPTNGIAEFSQIDIQGRPDADQWVTSFTIKYSLDGFTWMDYNGGAAFTANSDRNTVVSITLPTPLRAKSISLYPATFSGYRSCRWEVYYRPLPRVTITCFESGRISSQIFPNLANGVNGDRRNEHTVVFKNGFIRPPVVVTTMNNISMRQTDTSFHVSFIAHDVTITGFTCLVRSWNKAQLEDLTFDWIAFEPSE
eukprot:gene8354-9806_t